MHFTPLYLRKCAILVVIPLCFREYALMIVNMLFCQKPDYSGKNLMAQTRYSRRNVVMMQI